MIYFIEQIFNGVQLGMLLFLLAAGLTLIFGIMDLVNLAHGSLYMLGAYFAATFAEATDSFVIGAILALAATFVAGVALEIIAIRPLYGRNHLDHVLGTFGILIFFNDLVRLIWGPAGMTISLPSEMLNAVEVIPGVFYPVYRLVIIAATLAVAALLYFTVMRTRLGMLIRAGASNREMVGALGINIKLLYTLVFGLGAALAGFAGLMQAPILMVQIGMGENIVILAFVVIIIGGVGSIRGAFVASVLVGLIDTIGRAYRARHAAIGVERERRQHAGPGTGLDADLHADGWNSGFPAGRLVPGGNAMSGWLNPYRFVTIGFLVILALAAGLRDVDRQRIHDDAVHAHHHHGDRRCEPEPDHGLWRDGELRPCRLSRHWRLCSRHPVERRHRFGLRAMAGSDPRFRTVCSRCRRAQPAYARRLFHHDHARLCADDLLRGAGHGPLRRRRRLDDPPAQPVWRAARSQQPRAVLLSVFCDPDRQHLSGGTAGQFALRPGRAGRTLE